MCDNNSRLWLRKVCNNDKNLLLQWANDTTVRQNAFNQEQISSEEHEKWFKKVMNNNNVRMFIMMKEDIPIGQCRLDISNDGNAEISYSIDSEYRGCGFGKKMLNMIKTEVKNDHKDIKKLIGKVKANNISSMKCFEENGFTDSYHCYELFVDLI